MHERLAEDPVLLEMARAVQAADFKEQLDAHSAARGLVLISRGFPLVMSTDMVMSKLGWRAKIKRKFGKDPLLCERCGTEMVLWKVWTPTSGVFIICLMTRLNGEK